MSPPRRSLPIRARAPDSTNGVAQPSPPPTDSTVTSLAVSGEGAGPKEHHKEIPAPGLPTGWTVQEIPRKNPNNDNRGPRKDTYYYSPIEHLKFNSKPEVSRFIKCLDKANGDENEAHAIFRGKPISSNHNNNNPSTSTVMHRHSLPTHHNRTNNEDEVGGERLNQDGGSHKSEIARQNSGGDSIKSSPLGGDLQHRLFKKPAGRVLVATMTHGKQITVKVKLGGKEFVSSRRPKAPKAIHPPQASTFLPEHAHGPDSSNEDSWQWECPKCGRTNLPNKKRCGSCQSWKGGKRENFPSMNKAKKGLMVMEPEEEEEEELPPESDEKDEEEQEEDTDLSMGARLPKRKRTNVYASLDPRIIQGQIQASAEAYAMAPPSPQLASSKSNKRKQSFDKIPPIIAPPPSGIGHDGNLFYCRICLGVGEVVCCDGCPNVFHPTCLPSGPSKKSLENDDDPWFCHECVSRKSMTPMKKRRRTKDKLDQIFEAQSRRLSSPRLGTGRGRGRGSRAYRRMSSSEERMRRSRESSPSNLMRGRKRAYSSGFQSPYIETLGDDDAMGPESLALVEKPTSSTPAFFFFLLHNRAGIERSIYRKSRLFRGMPRGLARNSKVAQEGAAIWMEMSPTERNLWVDVAMKDFEQRLVAWKEKEVIESMMKSMDNGDKEKQNHGERGLGTSSQLSKTDEAYVASSRARLQQFNKVKSQPMATSATGSCDNPILLDLLNDTRFRPLPLVSATRATEDLAASREKMKVAVPQLLCLGPIETSLGDDCMGCTRGWNHFCPVLKRHIPCSEHRARLQPPVSSLTATRIGLGLKVNLPRESSQSKQSATDEGDNNNNKDDTGVAQVCPNYTPRDGFSLSTPSLRLDDVALFIEGAISLKTMLANTDVGSTEVNNSSGVKSKGLSRGLLPLRGRKKSLSNTDQDECELDSASSSNNGDLEKTRQYRCVGCSEVQSSPLGCMQCRKSKLIANVAKRSHSAPNSVADELLQKNRSIGSSNFGDGFVKPLSTMLGRSSLNDASTSGRKKNRENEKQIGLSLTKESWIPSVVLPPHPKELPTRKPPRLENGIDSDSDEETTSTGGSTTSSDESSCSSMVHANDDKVDDGDAQRERVGRRENITRSSPRTKSGGEEGVEIPLDRDALALKHKDDSKELFRKCLEIACCGILAGMVRRDPMRLFAEPVPYDVAEYHKVIQYPIDFGTMKKKIHLSEYTSLTSFVSDARRLCINACVFNAADSLYAKTAKTIYDALEIMYARAKEWMAMLKNAHSSSFIAANEEGKDVSNVDVFKDVKQEWPGAVELLNDGEWLKKQALCDFARTRENELAYYGTLAIQRAAAAAKASLLTSPDLSSDVKVPVVKRSHVQDEILRNRVNDAAALHVGPIELKDEPTQREYQLLKLLKRVQKRRIDGRMSSESGCARCDANPMSDETIKAVFLLRSKVKRPVDTTKLRVAASRSHQSTGLASRNAREKSIKAGTVGSVGIATDSTVSVRGSQVHGWGLYADRPFRKGEVVAEYIGEYVSDAVADMREKRYREQKIQDYQFRVDGSLVIDATLRGGYARYINHSCSPNCVAKIVDGTSPNEHLKRVLIVAQQYIYPSDELTYDYQFPLEMNLDLRIPCNCGSRHCRGFMNWDTPEKSNPQSTAKIIGNRIGRLR